MQAARINPEIFREYDIRGVVGRDLSPEAVRQIGMAYGSFMQRKELWLLDEGWPYKTHHIAGDGPPTVIVGKDNRKSSPELRDWLIDGIISTGCNVLDIGTVVTPVFYFARIYYGIEAGVQITGSHNPPEFNGFKIGKGPGTMYGAEIQRLKEVIEQGWFVRSAVEGTVEKADPVNAYAADLLERVVVTGKKLKVVVDCGNGTASFIAPRVLQALGCEVVPLYCDSDPDFPNHFPDPVIPANLQELSRKVVETGADLGVAYDGDADRIGVVDDTGAIIPGDILMALFWREILPKHPGALAIIEVKCSQALVREVEKLGGEPMFWKAGHSLIKAKMRETGAVFSGELSGHMFFADEHYGYDDAIYASARLIRMVAAAGKPLSQLWDDIPRYHSTPEVRVSCPDAVKFDVVERIKEKLEGSRPIVDVDGVRVEYPEYRGWALVRASNTQPVLVLRAESETDAGLQSIQAEMEKWLREAGLVWKGFEE
ncbi:MAG TPA: phosphomannomutase/phosphoglucomutase [Firmicutes bacterium]|nr:phosphomannomutase/phosphoglucomutase [Bacillota bacterium]